MKALLLAAGYATRLYPLTLDKPKALLPIFGRPIIDVIVDKLDNIRQIDNIFAVTNHKFYFQFKQWTDSKNARRKVSCPITVIDDGTLSNDDRLGAIADIEFVVKKEKIKDDILVIGADNIFQDKLSDFIKFAASKKDSSIVALYDLVSKDLAVRYGVVQLDCDNKIVDFKEKPKHPSSALISSCIYYFPVCQLERLKEYLKKDTAAKDASGNFIKWLSANDRVFGYILKGKWYDIGDIESYKKACAEFS